MNLEQIANECNITNREYTPEIVASVDKLKQEYTPDDLIIIYGYFLKHAKNANVMTYLIKCLDEIRYPAALDMLMDIVLLRGDYSDFNVEDSSFINTRVQAIKAISNLKDTKAVSGLLECLNNRKENYKVRLNAADALGKIGDKYAVMPLIDVACDEEEKSSYVRESAITALGMLGDMRALDSLVSILETQKGFIDKFLFLKERVIEAIGKLNFSNERVIKALKNSLTDDSPQIRINAIEALMNTEEESAFELIKTMLNDKNEEVVQNAVIALYNMNGVDILNEIIENSEYNENAKKQAEMIKEEYEDEDFEDDGDGEDYE